MTVGTIVAILIVFAVASAVNGDKINGFPILGDRETNNFILSVTFVPVERPKETVEVVAQLNGMPLIEEFPTNSPWTRPTHVPPGSTILLRAWQVSPGTLTCVIKKNGKKVAEKSTNQTGPLPGGVYCEYVNPV